MMRGNQSSDFSCALDEELLSECRLAFLHAAGGLAALAFHVDYGAGDAECGGAEELDDSGCFNF